MANLITIKFLECDPDPQKGYRVWWRVAGSGNPLTNVGDFFSSPAVFTDDTNPDGTQYEGYVSSNCRDTLGNPQFWTTEQGSGESSSGLIEEYRYYLADEYACPLCDFPVRTDILVRMLLTEVVQIGKFYKAQPNEGFAYQINSPDPQPAASSVLLTGENYTNCAIICS